MFKDFYYNPNLQYLFSCNSEIRNNAYRLAYNLSKTSDNSLVFHKLAQLLSYESERQLRKDMKDLYLYLDSLNAVVNDEI